MGEPPGGSRIVPILGIQWFQQPDLKLIYHDIPCSEDGAKFWCKPVLIGFNRYDPCMIDVLLDLDTHSSQIQTGWDAGVILPSPSETCCQLGHLAPKTWCFAGFPSQKQPVTSQKQPVTEFILFHTWILMADMCFIVVLCFFSRMSFENVSSICPHSGIFWLLSAKDAFHLLLMVFLCDNNFCMSVSFSFCLFCFPIRPPSHRAQPGAALLVRFVIPLQVVSPFCCSMVHIFCSFPNVPVSLNVAPLECSHVLYLMEICCPIPLAKTISNHSNSNCSRVNLNLLLGKTREESWTWDVQ